jgi:peptidoglycan-N-acetylglucosamine deacetylase
MELSRESLRRNWSNIAVGVLGLTALSTLVWPDGVEKARDIPEAVSDFIDPANSPVATTEVPIFTPTCIPGEKIFAISTERPEVAVTVDDGPSETTRQNLKVAEKYGATLTFFFIAEELQTPEGTAIAQEVLTAGHEIAAHSYSHNLRDASINAAEHSQANDVFKQTIGSVPIIYRPPGLLYSPELETAVSQAGQCFLDVTYGADTKDWQCDGQPGDIAIVGKNQRIDNLEYSPGFIYLVHDEIASNPQGRTTSPQTLDYLLSSLEAKGLSSVSTTQLLQSGEHITSMPPDLRNKPCV